MELNYKRCGDYLIPDVTCHHPHRSLGRYGRCLEIEEAARLRMEQLLPALAKDAGVTDELIYG